VTLPESSTRIPLSPEQKARNEAAKRVILFTVFLDILGFGIIIPQLGVYASQFGASPAMVGLLASTYSLMSFLSTPGWGRLSDRIGRRPVLLYSIFGTSIGYVVFAFAHSLPLLFLARFIDGITAGNISTAQAYLSDITAPEDRSKTFGIFGAIFGVGFAIGPAVGAALTHLPGVFSGNLGIGLFTATLSLINWALAVKRLPETLSPEVRRSNQAKDLKRDGGFASQFINIGGFQRAFKLPGLNIMIAISFFATLAFATLQGTFTLFLIKQYARPQVQTYILSNPQGAINEARKESSQAKAVAAPSGEGGENAVSLGDGENEPYPASMGGDFNSSTRSAPAGMTWRQIEKLLVRPRASQMAALIFAAIGIVALVVQGGLIGPLKKRFGELNLIVVGTLLMAIGLALVPFPKTFGWEFPVMGLLAFGNSIATPVLTALVSELSPENERGEMIGVFQSVGSLGRIFGPNVGGSLFSALGAGAPYLAGSLIMLVSLGFALVLKKSCPPHEIEPEPSL
jgi:DHA1 family tetracycline resistance protein-like MFS transporter